MGSSELSFENRVVLVTGGARGLGLSYVKILCERGARVLAADRSISENQSEEFAKAAETFCRKGGRVILHRADIGSRTGAQSAVEAALSAFGRLDAVVNNAGVLFSHHFRDYPELDFDKIMDVHVRGSWNVTQAAWPSLVKSGSGRIINTVSRAAFFGEPADVAYSAAKAALYGLTRSLARVGANDGIKVNAICPVAWTDLFAGTRKLNDAERAAVMDKYKTTFVSPIIAVMAHQECPCSGEVIASVGGTVRRYFVSQTKGSGIDNDFTPEQFLESFDKVADGTSSLPIELISYQTSDSA